MRLGVIPGVGLVLATLLTPTKLPGKILTNVNPICLCKVTALDYPGQEGASMRVGQQAWFWLGRKGWQLPSLSPVAWTESLPLRRTGAQH